MRLFIVVMLSVAFLTSCAQVPKRQSYFMSYQHKLQATKHWNRVAEDASDRIKTALKNQVAFKRDGIKKENSQHISIKDTEKINASGPIFIQNYDLSPFGSTFRTLLITKLMNKGIRITYDNHCPYKFNWEVQRVKHIAGRKNKPGLLPFILFEPMQWIFLGENDCFEDKPHYEVIITYILEYNNLNLIRNSGIYYINDEDFNHYWVTRVNTHKVEADIFTIVNE